ncbi:toxin-activating lysine-acyltransferase [Herbaspirillum seropedicae]|uniref:toxin-activating lysine-acyltransferase n=1 Tax=Herbaspirillum seropedicae TaxID=964 RepID=UPI003D9601A8
MANHIDLQRILGGATLLAGQSALHGRYPVGFMLSRWREALANNNFNYLEAFHKETGQVRPLQFVAWKFVSQSWVEQLRASQTRLDYWGQEIEDGPYLFVIDLLSADIDPVFTLRNLVHQVLQQREVKGVAFIRYRDEEPSVCVIEVPKVLRNTDHQSQKET